MLALLLATVVTAATPVYPFDETISLLVDQHSTLLWDTDKTGVVDRWILRCSHLRREVLNTQQTSLRFGELDLDPGTYTQCGFTAVNETGESVPYPVPNFSYVPSSWPLTRALIDLVALCVSTSTLFFVGKRHVMRWVQQRALRHETAPLLLTDARPSVLYERTSIPKDTVIP